jgi:signal transduction histidine kinase
MPLAYHTVDRKSSSLNFFPFMEYNGCMKIRDKLFLGFGLYIFIAAVLGSFAYRELSTITTRLALVEIADDITNTILEIRRYEKLFLLLKDNESRQELNRYLASLKQAIDTIKSEIIKEIGKDNHDMMKKAIAEYENLYTRVAETIARQEALITLVREKGRGIENKLAGRELEAFLVVRKDEKNLMLYRDDDSLNIFMKTLDSSGLLLNRDVEGYRTLVNRLSGLFKEEKDSVNNMRLKAREIQSFTESLSKKERTDISAILRKSMNILLYALLAIIVVGAIINRKLAMSIAVPIRNLEKITKKVATGDFSEHILVKGHDEISSLQISFNQMEERLNNALNSLASTVDKLQEKQAQLVEAEKHASIGILAAGIAHEINNPLTSVLTFSNLMLEQAPEDSPNYTRLKMMVVETERARNIVRQLLSFAKETPIHPVRININQPVTEIVDSLIAQGAFTDIELALDLANNLPEITADPARIGQVVLNILLNAIHSITPPGKITLVTGTDRDFVTIAIHDTGSGISEEHIGKIFDPFFTTKEGDKGTGLGLAVSYGIIKKHGGEIAVASSLGKGSTFTVRLPVHAED